MTVTHVRRSPPF